MQQHGVMEELDSPLVIPAVIIRKKNGDLH
jgi:hypothetical protein